MAHQLRYVKVLHVLNELKRSGAENMLRSAAPFLSDSTFHNIILSTGVGEGEYAQDLREAGYDIFHIPHARSPSFFLNICRLISQEKVDIVHIHAERDNLVYVLAAKMLGKHVVRTIHNTFLFNGPLRYRRIITRAVTRLLGVKQIACAKAVLDNEWRRFHNKVDLVENWIDQDIFNIRSDSAYNFARSALGIDQNAKIMITTGSCIASKNHMFLIELLRSLPENYKLLHCGSGELECLEKNRAAEIGVAERIMFVGSTPHVLAYLNAADFFVMASHFEGGSIALLEALAVGLPCITTRVGMATQLENLPNLRIAEADSGQFSDALAAFAGRPGSLAASDARQTSDAIRLFYSPQRGAADYKSAYENCANVGAG